MTSPYFQRIASAFVFAFAVVFAIYAIFSALGFTVTSFLSLWVLAPLVSIFIFAFVANKGEFNTIGNAYKAYLRNRSNVKILALFVLIFVFWALLISAADWAVPTNYSGSDCTFSDSLYDSINPDSSFCTMEDLNNSKRNVLTDLIDKFASAIFIVAPFALIYNRTRSWIVE